MFDETTNCFLPEQLAIHAHFIDKVSGSLNLLSKVIDVLQSEVNTLGSTHGEVSACISVCADTLAHRIHEFVDQAQIGIAKLRQP